MTSAELEQKRKRSGVTQEELAQELGVFKQTLSNFASGELDDLFERMDAAIDAVANRKRKSQGKEVSVAA
jgi:transcriptional regulator with XRE-family HTH domain